MKNDRQYNDQTNGEKRWRMTGNTMTKLMGKKVKNDRQYNDQTNGKKRWRMTDNTMTKLMGEKGEEWQTIQWPN